MPMNFSSACWRVSIDEAGWRPWVAQCVSVGLRLLAFGLIPTIDLALRRLQIGRIVRIEAPRRTVAGFLQRRQFADVALMCQGRMVPERGEVAALRWAQMRARAFLHAARGTTGEQERQRGKHRPDL